MMAEQTPDDALTTKHTEDRDTPIEDQPMSTEESPDQAVGTVKSPDPAISTQQTTVTRSPFVRRRRGLLIVAAVAALGSVVGLIASTAVRSPAQVAADTQAPPASVLTAEVVRKTLSTSLVMRGLFNSGRRYEFTPASVAPTANGPGGSTMVITAVRTKASDEVRPGAVLLEVSERPVFVLPGAFPAYRDMKPGQSGKDIAQLQAGLARVGFRSTDRSGYFGASTQSAVRRFYQARGYPVPLTDPPPVESTTATTAPAQPPSEPDGPATGVTTPSVTPTETAPAKAAPIRPTTLGPNAVRGVRVLAASLVAREDPRVAMVPMSEVVFLPDGPARVASFAGRVGDTVAAPMIAFSVDGLTLNARLDPTRAGLVKVGIEVTVLAEATGFTGTGTVATVGARVTDAAAGNISYIPLAITPGAAWPAELEGQDARVTVTTASTAGDVLAVPVAAISSTADGRTTVTVLEDDVVRRPVEVKAGVSADGWVEVTGVAGAPFALEPGDRVVTGT